MEQLIVLCGENNTGKTITLRMLAALLYPCGPIIQPIQKTKTVVDIWAKIVSDMDSSKGAGDFRTIIELSGKKIGIYSYGDTEKLICEGVKFFQDNACDIGVMPCHPKKSHFEILVSEYGSIMTVFPKRKVVSNERYFENISMATQLYQTVIKYI